MLDDFGERILAAVVHVRPRAREGSQARRAKRADKARLLQTNRHRGNAPFHIAQLKLDPLLSQADVVEILIREQPVERVTHAALGLTGEQAIALLQALGSLLGGDSPEGP